MVDRIKTRDDIPEGDDIKYWHRQRSTIYRLEVGDTVDIRLTSNQNAPTGKSLVVVEVMAEEVRLLDTTTRKSLIMTPNGFDKGEQFTKLMEEDGTSLGEVFGFEVTKDD
jgi:hypothetical protein